MATLTNTKPTSSLADLLAEERHLFRDYDEPNGRRVNILRARIEGFPCKTMGDVSAKAQWVAQLLVDAGETLDDAIRSEGMTDIGMALCVVRDLLRLQGLLPQVVPDVATMPVATPAVN